MAVGQDLHDVLRVHAALAPWLLLERHPLRLALLVLLVDFPRQLDVERVARLDRVDVGLEPHREKAQVADDIENLVADELVLVAERFAGENRVARG
jgi:hypothetical protein